MTTCLQLRPWCGILILTAVIPSPLLAARGVLELTVVDAQSREPIAVQMQLVNPRNRPVWPAGLPRDGQGFVFDGRTVLQLPPGSYSFRLRRGLEYRERTGHFELQSGAADHHEVDLPRIVDITTEGWWSGDLQFQPVSTRGLDTRILAADLHLIPAIVTDGQRASEPMAASAQQLASAIGAGRILQWNGRVERRLGTQVRLWTMREVGGASQQAAASRSSLEFVQRMRQTGPAESAVHVHLTHVTDWDLPNWLGLGLIDSVGLLHDGLTADGPRESPEDRPRDPTLFPGPDGAGQWTHQTYFRVLEAGLKIPPGGGSGADGAGNPLGYARTYVHCGPQFTADRWWTALRSGQVVVTNGPLLRPRVNGQLPGHVFQARSGESLRLRVELQLSTQDKIRYLEVVQNGRPAYQVRLDEWLERRGELPELVFDASGWLLVRAVAEDSRAFRGAISGPFYVEFDGQPRISRRAAEYFQEWTYERARRWQEADPLERQAVLPLLRAARDFWQQRLAAANAD